MLVIHADPARQLVRGSFGAVVTEEAVELPEDLVDYLRLNGVAAAETFVSFVNSFVSVVAANLDWEIEDVVRARDELTLQLEGRIRQRILHPGLPKHRPLGAKLTREERALLEKSVSMLTSFEIFTRQHLVDSGRVSLDDLPPPKELPTVDPCWYGAELVFEDVGLVLTGGAIGRVPLGESLAQLIRTTLSGDPCAYAYLVDYQKKDGTILELVALHADGQRKVVWKEEKR